MIVKYLEFGPSFGESSLLSKEVVISLGNLDPSFGKVHCSPRNFGPFLEENSLFLKETTIFPGKLGLFPWKIHCSSRKLFFKELSLFHGEFTLLFKAT